MSQLPVDGVGCCYTASEYNYLEHSSTVLLWQSSTHQQIAFCFNEVPMTWVCVGALLHKATWFYTV